MKPFIGNDILAIHEPMNRQSFSNLRFIRKICTHHEWQLLQSAPDIDFLPQIFWTSKESAYKIAMKLGYKKNFVPAYFEVVSLQKEVTKDIFYTGRVKFQENMFFLRSVIRKDYIATISCVCRYSLARIVDAMGSAETEKQSETARRELLQSFISATGTEESNITFGKDFHGIPFVKVKDRKMDADISFSHDGEFYSYAYLIY